MRLQLSRYSALLAATCLVLLAACGDESARTALTEQASEGDRAVTSAANLDADAMLEAPVADDSNTRPVLERRVSTSAQVVAGRPVPGGTDAEQAASSSQVSRGSNAARGPDNDSVAHSAEHEDGDEDGEAHEHEDGDQDDEDDEPQVDPREQRLAWLAQEWEGQDLPAASAHASGGGSVARIGLRMQ